MASSALVATQMDAGSAAEVPNLLAQLRNATDQGQLKVSAACSCLPHHWMDTGQLRGELPSLVL